MPAHNWTVAVSDGTSHAVSLSRSYIITDEGAIIDDVPVLANQTNKQIAIAFALANVKSLILKSSAAITLKTNSTSDPGAELSMGANQEVVWNNQMGYPLSELLGVDVTTMYYVSGAGTGTLAISIILDVTP